jgi:hypothetical protein
MRNDVIDLTYAAYGLCFDGVFSEDKLVKELYEKGHAMLDLFVKHAPKAPHGKKAKIAPIQPSSLAVLRRRQASLCAEDHGDQR